MQAGTTPIGPTRSSPAACPRKSYGQARQERGGSSHVRSGLAGVGAEDARLIRLQLAVSYVAGRRHLPIIELRRAA